MVDVEKPVAPQRTVASKYGDLRIWVPKPKSAVSAWRGRGVPELVMGRRLRLDGKGDAAGHAPAGDHRTKPPAPPMTTTLMLAAASVIGTRSSSLRRCIQGAQARIRDARFSSDPHPGLVEEIGGHIVAGPAVGGAGRCVLGAQGDEVLALADRRVVLASGGHRRRDLVEDPSGLLGLHVVDVVGSLAAMDRGGRRCINPTLRA